MAQELRLVELKLHNFKGVKDFTLKSDGESVRVFGDNATGKTTLFDAFIWLLFDKDSANRKDFSIKTIESGVELHGLNHEVEGVFRINNKPLSLKKVFSEKWTKKRGAATKEFTGHTTDYFIDSVPAKKKDFVDRVSQIVDEDIFKLLTSPTYFNEQLHFKEKRKILLEVCGDISDKDVINSNKELAKLESILNGKSIEDHRKIIAAKRKEINNELEKLPIRIDEVNRSKPDVSNLIEQEINDEIQYLNSLVEGKEQELIRIQNGSEITEKQKQLRILESDLMAIKNKHQELNYGMLNDKQKEVYEIQNQLDSLKQNHRVNQREIDSFQSMLSQKEKNIQDLRLAWHNTDKETFENHQTTCPTCGQDLPEEQIEEAIKRFNLEKSNKLEEITSNGKRLNEEKTKIVAEIESHEAAIEMREKEIAEKEQQFASVKSELEHQKENVSRVENTGEYQEKVAEIKAVEESIGQLKQSTVEESNKVKTAIAGIKEEVSKLNQDRAQFVALNKANQRIEQLQEEEKELAREFEQLEQELYLTEEFIRTKVQLLTEKINSKFKYARFKLFDTQINDGLKETCETLYKGVPYGGGLNNAARINVGLDIINTLSEHYGFMAPIFVDNSEAVTRLIETNAQVVSLVVSGKDKELRIEQQNELNREAV
jgi:DNA repair exonuclease SbcCD ATPase subunit